MYGKTLLIIDDEPSILYLVEEMLRDWFENVLTAGDGLTALDIISNDPTISCVICDIQMPVMGGIETIKNARERGHNVPFIFYTGFGDRKTRAEAQNYGAMDFLEKPYIDPLINAVAKIIHKQDL